MRNLALSTPIYGCHTSTSITRQREQQVFFLDAIEDIAFSFLLQTDVPFILVWTINL